MPKANSVAWSGRAAKAGRVVPGMPVASLWLRGRSQGRRIGLRHLLLATTAFVTLVPGLPAGAADWTGAVSTDWFDDGNWNPFAPTIGTTANINTIAPAPNIVGLGAIADELNVGFTGPGGLTIMGGGSLLTTNTYIARTTALGAVLVTGNGSSWTNTVDLNVGYQDQGTLAIAAGGSVTVHGKSAIGFSASAQGLVSVSGQNSTWAVSGPLSIGNFGSGTLNIGVGGTVNSADATLAVQAGAQGKATVTGGTWASSGQIVVGGAGAGTLEVTAGGVVNSGSGVVGNAASGSGEATVSGAGSRWTTSGSLLVGAQGSGQLTIANGGAVLNNDDVVVGDTGTGHVTVTGANSNWTVTGTNVLLGNGGSGSARVEAGGVVQTVDVRLGQLNGGGSGSVEITGANSRWDSSGEFSIGRAGSGTMTVLDGAKVTSGILELGYNATGVGTLTISGIGSSWTNATTLRVGNSGTGTMNIASGATVSTLDSVIGHFNQGALNVSGSGSSLVNTGNMLVGGESTGALSITGGGKASAQTMIVGHKAGSGGNISVSGAGSQLLSPANLFVGMEGNGVMFVQAGGTVQSGTAALGTQIGSIGEATVTGSGSTWLGSADLYIGADGTGALTVADGGRVEVGGTAHIAATATSSGTLNIGRAKGLAAAAPGTFATSAIAFGSGNGKIVFNHSSDSYQFAAGMTGTGTIEAISGTTVLTGNSSGFNGTTTVSGGTLAVNGSLGGTVDVLAGARLQGSGTVGAMTIGAGAVVAPGNSIGTLNVAGNATFNAGSRYEVEVDPAGTASDRVHATGTITINGGTVRHIGLNGAYSPSRSYTIVTADGGVNGTFANVISDFAFLDPTLSYDPNNVYLRLDRNDVSFCSVGQTLNQCATGGGVQSLGFGNPVHDAVVTFGEAGARAAFDALSGEVHASAKGVLIDESGVLRAAATDRLRSALGAVGAPQMPVLSYGFTADKILATTGPMPRLGPAERFAVWGQGYGSWGHTDGDGNAARLSRSTGGLMVGADVAAFDALRFGAFAGYSRTRFKVRDRISSGDSDNYHLGLYGGGQWGALGLRTGASYTWHEVGTSRTVAFAGFGDALKADYSAATAQVFGELGYRIDLSRVALEPFAGLAYVNLRSDGFGERGGPAALTAAGSATATGFSTLGVRASTSLALQGVELTLRGTLAWRHAFGDVTPLATAVLAGGSAFTVAGIPIARNAALLEAGLDLAISPRATLGLSYTGQLATDSQDHAFKGNLAVRF
jgi:subtilase-type serine protease